MAVNISGLSQAKLALGTLGGLLFVSPSRNNKYEAQNGFFKDGDNRGFTDTFVFNYEGENKVSLESDITDHYTENNSAINDQIALKPEVVVTRGYIGELTDIIPEFLEPARTALEKLIVLSAYTPELTIGAILAYNEAVQLASIVTQTINSTIGAIAGLTGLETQNKQQQAFNQFYGWWQTRQLFTVQTPWNKFENMAIKSINYTQDQESRMISEFEVSFKKIRIASSLTINPTLLNVNYQGRGQEQYKQDQIDDHGGVALTPSEKSFADSISGVVA